MGNDFVAKRQFAAFFANRRLPRRGADAAVSLARPRPVPTCARNRTGALSELCARLRVLAVKFASVQDARACLVGALRPEQRTRVERCIDFNYALYESVLAPPLTPRDSSRSQDANSTLQEHVPSDSGPRERIEPITSDQLAQVLANLRLQAPTFSFSATGQSVSLRELCERTDEDWLSERRDAAAFLQRSSASADTGSSSCCPASRTPRATCAARTRSPSLSNTRSSCCSRPTPPTIAPV